MAALVFDFDGLIVETEIVEFRAWAEVLGEMGAVVEPADFLPLIGTHQPGLFAEMIRRWLGDDVDLEALGRRARDLRHPLALAAPLQAGVQDLLDEAHHAGWLVGLGSSSPREWIEMHLTHRGLLSRFDAVVTREDVAAVKPAPDIFLEVARRLGVPPEECVVLEDSGPGCLAAHGAGMACVAVPTDMTRGSDFSRAQRVVSSLADVRLADLAALINGTR